jgi:hypothetical protein
MMIRSMILAAAISTAIQMIIYKKKVALYRERERERDRQREKEKRLCGENIYFSAYISSCQFSAVL